MKMLTVSKQMRRICFSRAQKKTAGFSARSLMVCVQSG